jgi:hypothetical protein
MINMKRVRSVVKRKKGNTGSRIETEEVKFRDIGNDQVINCAHHDSALRLEMRG